MMKVKLFIYLFLFFTFIIFGVFASNQISVIAQEGYAWRSQAAPSLAQPGYARQQSQENQEGQDSPTFFYYFYCPRCPVCDVIEVWFKYELEPAFPDLEIKWMNVGVGGTDENRKLIHKLAEASGVDPGRLGVPAVFIGKHHLIGMPGTREKQAIKGIVEYCLIHECLSPQDFILKQDVVYNDYYKYKQKVEPIVEPIRKLDYITLPFVGEIYIAGFSFPIITIIIAAADGFNPCALWVLMFLILLVLKEPSRKRLVLIAGTFILVSGIFYFFLLAAWLKLFLLIGHIRTIQLIIGTVALGVGIWQLKSFFSKKAGTCKISKKGSKIHNIIAQKAKKVITQKGVFLTIIGVAGLAIAVNFFEFLCSAGFPAIWSSLLALQGFAPIYNILFMLLYVFIFMLDQIIIFTITFFTLKVTKITDKITKWTGLIGGLLMIVLGLIVLFKPEWLIFI